MAVEIISRSISTKVWDLAGIELATPESAVRHVTDCTTRSGLKGFYFVLNFACLMWKKSVLEYVINTLYHGVLVTALSISPGPLSALSYSPQYQSWTIISIWLQPSESVLDHYQHFVTALRIRPGSLSAFGYSPQNQSWTIISIWLQPSESVLDHY